MYIATVKAILILLKDYKVIHLKSLTFSRISFYIIKFIN